MSLRIGIAGWSIPGRHRPLFSEIGSHLERYARLFRCVESNSSFYRPHRPATYARWAASTPEDFRFSVKAPKAMTPQSSLAPTHAQMQSFLHEVRHLGGKLGPILLQFPPRQGFDPVQAEDFFCLFRDLYPTGHAAVEARHDGWFCPEAEQLLQKFQMARVMADPPPVPEAARPGGDLGLVYARLHGSPRMHYSSYPVEWLEHLGSILSTYFEVETWCVFDNTALGAAIDNASTLARGMSPGQAEPLQ